VNSLGFSIIICYEKGFLLPVLNTAFDNVIGKYKHLKDRYLNAIILSPSDKAMKIVDVTEAEKIGSFCFGMFITKSRISFVTKELQEEREYVYGKLSDAAISRQSYSVWGQFHDSREALKAAILKCRNFQELIGVMNIDGLGHISKEIL
jgi:hypothetical protein